MVLWLADGDGLGLELGDGLPEDGVGDGLGDAGLVRVPPGLGDAERDKDVALPVAGEACCGCTAGPAH